MKIEFNRRSRRKEVIAVHFGTSKQFSWSVPDGADIQVNDLVWVDTCYGEDIVKVIDVIPSRGKADREVLGRVTSLEIDSIRDNPITNCFNCPHEHNCICRLTGEICPEGISPEPIEEEY